MRLTSLISPRRLRAFAVAASFVVGGLSPAFAADPRAGISDTLLTRSALAALDADPNFRDVNIVVSIVDRQAVIGGVVPSPDLAQRAEAIVRRATGIEVKNRCFVQAQPDPLIRAVADRLNPTAKRPTSHDLPGMVRPPRMGLEDSRIVPPSQVANNTPPAPTPVVALKIPTHTNPRPSLLLDPTASPVGPRYASQPPVPTVSPVPARLTTTMPVSSSVPPTVPARPSDLMSTLLDLRRSEARFAGLTVEVRDGSVYLGGTSPRDGDPWDFAERIRRVPGVRQVVVGNVYRR